MKITETGNLLVFSELTPGECKRLLNAAKSNAPGKERMISYRQAAVILGVCTETVKRYVKRGRLNSRRLSRSHVRLYESEVIDADQHGFGIRPEYKS